MTHRQTKACYAAFSKSVYRLHAHTSMASDSLPAGINCELPGEKIKGLLITLFAIKKCFKAYVNKSELIHNKKFNYSQDIHSLFVQKIV